MNVQRNVADEVIPELDENMTTIVSMRGERKPPTVHDIFGTGPTSTAPVDIPGATLDKAAAREKFFQQENRPERPTQLSVSAPPQAGQLRPLPTESRDPFSEDNSSEGEESSATVSPDAGFHSELKSDNFSDEGKDLSMDDIQVNNRKPSDTSLGGSSSLAGKLAKSLGFKEKEKPVDLDNSEVHLLSDVSRIKEDSEEEAEDEFGKTSPGKSA